MSATDQMRQMLDQLMGTSRNGKYFLITCPGRLSLLLLSEERGSSFLFDIFFELQARFSLNQE